MRKIRVILAAVMSIFIVFTVCGCDLFTVDTDELLSPPALAGEMALIEKALLKSVEGTYTLKYPTLGERRSAITVEDIDGDGILEAFAFYSTTDGETVNMNLGVIVNKKGRWKTVATATITAGGVEKIDFCDLDADGIQEVLVGWEVYGTTEKKLGVYSLKDGQLSERMVQQYTTYVCCDLNSDGADEIFLQLLNTAESTNRASIYTILDGGVRQMAGCSLDVGVKSVVSVDVRELSSKTPAVFIDESKGTGNITEVLFMENGELLNPLLDTETGENTQAVRYVPLGCKDINSDGVIEIPISAPLPYAKGESEKVYYTNWCSFDGSELEVKTVTVVNTTDNYYLTVPERLIGHIAIERDSDNHSRTFYSFDGENAAIGEKLFAVYAVKAEEYGKFKKVSRNAFVLYKNDTTVFAGEVFDGADAGLKKSELKSAFYMLS